MDFLVGWCRFHEIVGVGVDFIRVVEWRRMRAKVAQEISLLTHHQGSRNKYTRHFQSRKIERNPARFLTKSKFTIR